MVVTKTEAQCKNYYFNYKKKHNLEALVLQSKMDKVMKYAISIFEYKIL